jgi:hypothetical protein
MDERERLEQKAELAGQKWDFIERNRGLYREVMTIMLEVPCGCDEAWRIQGQLQRATTLLRQRPAAQQSPHAAHLRIARPGPDWCLVEDIRYVGRELYGLHGTVLLARAMEFGLTDPMREVLTWERERVRQQRTRSCDAVSAQPEGFGGNEHMSFINRARKNYFFHCLINMLERAKGTTEAKNAAESELRRYVA